MTCNHPLWQEQDYEKGNAILSELAPSPEARMAKAKTELERDFIAGVDILFGKGNKAERDSSYAVYMGALYKKYPGNNEVASFYSLALNGWGTTERNKSILEKAASVSYEVLARNPNHPGALHYVIHAYDDPDHAALALATADKYALTAPDAGHALHMPTHTYLALGIWDKVITSNEVSWAAEKARKTRKKLNNDALGYHSFHWLEYGYLQKGYREKARPMIDSMFKYCSQQPSPKARAHMILLKTTYLAETNDYDPAVVGIKVRQDDLNIVMRAKNYFTNGMQAYYDKDVNTLDDIILALSGERLIEASKAADKGLRLCGNINRSMATRSDLQEAEVMELQLKAMKALLVNDHITTEKLLKEATKLQIETGYAYGPPAVVKPAFEMYGEWLLANKRPQEALEQFEKSLQWAPNKHLSLKGRDEAKKMIAKTGLATL
jgi:tetratricopeptide (TPR) repeat protein